VNMLINLTDYRDEVWDEEEYDEQLREQMTKDSPCYLNFNDLPFSRI
jgi:hypothetical protein